MALCTIKELVDLKNTRPSSSIYHNGRRVPANEITEGLAKEILDHSLKIALAKQQLSKMNRPWEIINITDKLDPKQPWVGFEYETGLKDKADYEAIINYVWFNTMHVAYDLEGFGAWCPEITYPPQNLSEYVNNKSYIQKTLEWMQANNIKMLDFEGRWVGTHLNLSTPAYRAMTYTDQEAVARVLSRSLIMLSPNEMVGLFGRRLYGGATAMGGGWTEFKMFKSTDDPKVFSKYIKIATHMAEVMEYVCRNKIIGPKIYINNLIDVLSGKTSADNMDIRSSDQVAGNVPSAGWRHHSGTYERYRNNGEKVNHNVRAAA